MDTEQMIREVRHEAEKYKDVKVFTGQTNLYLMLTDVANRLEELNEKVNGGK